MRFINPKELAELQKTKDAFLKKPLSETSGHKHSWERVFHLNPAMGLLNSRVFDICSNCGERKDVEKSQKMKRKIDEILKERKVFEHEPR